MQAACNANNALSVTKVLKHGKFIQRLLNGDQNAACNIYWLYLTKPYKFWWYKVFYKWGARAILDDQKSIVVGKD